MTQSEPTSLVDRRRTHHLRLITYVLDLIERRDLHHVMVVTQEAGADVAVHSGWSSKFEELMMLARAQHSLNRVIDGTLDDHPLFPDDEPAG